MQHIKTIVTHVNNLHDARYCAGMGVDWIALPVGDGGLSEKTFSEILGWLSGPRIAGLCEGPLEGNYGIEAIVTSNAALASTYKGAVMLLVDFPASMTFEALAKNLASFPNVSAFLIHSTERALDDNSVEEFAKLAKKHPIFIGFGVSSANIELVAQKIQPEGITLKAGKEEKVGVNDFEELADVLEKIMDINE